jgi:hypothetical protein
LLGAFRDKVDTTLAADLMKSGGDHIGEAGSS